MKKFRALLLGDDRENDTVLNTLAHNMSALYMQGSSGGASSSQFNNGASSSSSSKIESST